MENWTMEIWLGAALTLCWALVIVWSLGRIAVFAWRTPGKGNHNWGSRSFAAGLLVGAALAGGLILATEPAAVLFGSVHTIGLGFVLAFATTFVLYVFANAAER
jgi:hypothetical protein